MSQCPTVARRIQLRHDTSTNWSSVGNSLVLLAGEFAYETDTGRVKVGDGVRNWNSLPYFSQSGPTGPTGPIGIPNDPVYEYSLTNEAGDVKHAGNGVWLIPNTTQDTFEFNIIDYYGRSQNNWFQTIATTLSISSKLYLQVSSSGGTQPNQALYEVTSILSETPTLYILFVKHVSSTVASVGGFGSLLTFRFVVSGPTGPAGFGGGTGSGPTGPTGPANTEGIIDGGDPFTDFVNEPLIDCGSVV